MERRHIIRIILLEAFLMFGIGLIVALFFGILLDKLILVLLFQIIHQPIPEGFFINTGAIFSTILLTLGIAGLIIIRGVYSILRTKDIDLLKSEKKGEQEPKTVFYLPLWDLSF
jgi:putative ABC transport system permease protein